MPKKAQTAAHATLTFKRVCAASVERVFAALADAKERERWGAPSENAAFFYERDDFRVGGRDVFRCGAKNNPQYRGVTTYFDIVPNERIVSSETIETDGVRLFVSLNTMVLEPKSRGTKITLTSQVVSYSGKDMIEGVKDGNNSSLDNLVQAMKLPPFAKGNKRRNKKPA